MLQSYRSSNRVPTTGLFFLMLAVLCGGIVFGGLAYALSQLIWIIIVFPLVLGFVAGTLLAEIIARRHIRNASVGLAAGLLVGVVAYGTFHYASYMTFQSELRQMIAEQHDLLDTSAQDVLVDTFLEAETGNTGFVGYLQLMAHEGVSIGKIGRSSHITLNQPLTWGYWLIELSLISGLAAVIACQAAKKPFCESCQQWYQGGKHLGSIPDSAGQQFLAYVRSGDFRQAGALLMHDYHSSPSFEVYVQRCLHDQEHPSIFTVRHATVNAKGTMDFKDVAEGLISAYDINEIGRGQVEPQGLFS